jgi:hypothetical protein
MRGKAVRRSKLGLQTFAKLYSSVQALRVSEATWGGLALVAQQTALSFELFCCSRFITQLRSLQEQLQFEGSAACPLSLELRVVGPIP